MTGTAVLVPENIDRFKAFLVERGCDVLMPTNEWEVLRFRTERRIVIAYKNKHDRISVVGDTIFYSAADAFLNKKPWRGRSVPPSQFRRGTKTRPPLIASLISRDGDNCWYCGDPLEDDVTIEHLVARTLGGPDTMANMTLAHEVCNKKAGHISVAAKVRLRETMRKVQTMTRPLGPEPPLWGEAWEPVNPYSPNDRESPVGPSQPLPEASLSGRQGRREVQMSLGLFGVGPAQQKTPAGGRGPINVPALGKGLAQS